MTDKLDLRPALAKIGFLVEADARRKCPIRTGQLVGSITSEVVSDDAVVIGSNVEYAPYVEFGTGLFASGGDGRKDVPWNYQDAQGEWHSTCGQHPQPYLQPAVDENIGTVNEIIQEAVSEWLTLQLNS